MKEIIIKEIAKGLNLHEKIIAKIFAKTLIKAYKIGITFGFNSK